MYCIKICPRKQCKRFILDRNKQTTVKRTKVKVKIPTINQKKSKAQKTLENIEKARFHSINDNAYRGERQLKSNKSWSSFLLMHHSAKTDRVILQKSESITTRGIPKEKMGYKRAPPFFSYSPAANVMTTTIFDTLSADGPRNPNPKGQIVGNVVRKAEKR